MLIERYILKNLAQSFLGATVALTAVVWITQVLRDFDLVTAQGQSFLVLMHISSLSLPALLIVIMPVALFIAVVFTHVRLNADSELITMHAAGLSPARLFRPTLLLAIVVSALVAWMTLSLAPKSFRDLRYLLTVVRADLVANLLREGRFNTLEQGLTFHIKEREPTGRLRGIFVQDRREGQQILTYIADSGLLFEEKGATYLLLEKGSLQRQVGPQADAALVAFEQYAIDLSQFTSLSTPVFKPRERTTAELLWPDEKEEYYQFQKGRFRSELHDRFSTPLLALAFAVLAYVAVGSPATTRQGRARAVLTAVVLLIALRTMGFGASSFSARQAWGVILVYALPAGILLACAGKMLVMQGALRPRWMGMRLR